MKVINFEVKRQQREQYKRHEYIQSMCQFQRPDLFDELIAETEKELTQDKIDSCNEFIDVLKRGNLDPLTVFQEATFMYGNDFYEKNGIDWSIMIENALTYYAINRKYSRDQYELALQMHPFISSD